MNIFLMFLILLSKPIKEPLTPKAVYNYCIEQGVLHPEIVTAQAIEESGWFNCSNCSLDNNNIFGFYYKGAYVSFNDWKESVDYYKRWQDKYYDPDRDYYDFLACMYKSKNGNCIKYAANPDAYNKDVKSIVNDYSKLWTSN